VTRSPTSRALLWPVIGAVAFAVAVIAKYGYLVMALPLVGLLVSVRGVRRSGLPPAVFLAIVGVILAVYFWLAFWSLLPASSTAYLEQTFGRSRGHIAMLQVIFGIAPAALATLGAVVAWRRGQRMLVVTCLLALTLYPAFHLWTANFVSGQKHVVAGFLFAYLLAGVGCERLWTSRSPVTAVALMAALATWGGLQCYWQDRSWSDTRPLARHLVENMKRGDRVLAESSWSYTLDLYPRRLVESPADVIDANYAPGRDRLDLCRIPWLVGNPDSAELIRRAAAHCPHRRVLASTTPHYYVDTTRLRPGIYSVVIGLYRLPGS
jgi:hypothetical protein